MIRIAFVDGEHRRQGVELTVREILARLQQGETPVSLAAQYPPLSADDIERCVKYAVQYIQ